MSLELSDLRLVVKIPNCDVSITAAAEADLGVGADGEGVAGRRRAGHLCLYPGGGGGQIPDAEVASFPTNDKGAAVRQQLDGPDVVLSLQTVQLADRGLVGRLGDVPHLDAPLPASVHEFGGVGHGYRTHYFTVGEGVDLPGVAWYAGGAQCVVGKADGLQLVVPADVERVGPETMNISLICVSWGE